MASYDFSSLVSLVPDAWLRARGWLNELVSHINTTIESIETDINTADKVRQANAGALTSTFSSLWGVTVPVGAIVVRKDTPMYTVFEWNGTSWVQLFGITHSTVAPTTAQDNTQGYYVGWRWIDTVTKKEYVLVDSSTGTAQWIETTFVSAGGNSYILLQDSRTSGTGGSTCTVGWNTRTLQTEVYDTGSHCSLSSNRFTLAAGTYQIRAMAANFQTSPPQRQRLALYNHTDSVYVLYGLNNLIGPNTGGGTAYGIDTPAELEGRFTIATSKAFELRHYLSAAVGGSSLFGMTLSLASVNEIYASVNLMKEG